ncbi:tetratricopeptide repeat protein [Neolewinella aurantiaca]|uniref:Tetratricopeptide repeat protein n=1 Tax=Neolewinella aurantiaca TaxID=2602767 RepID=A0A5C7FJN0_9BACT|nr:tetratricopeptide repeat protein [Neolewinella aurantiaca]TXF91505.1 tetratricopeptide repeat protein [Neolewinella aurantiaca]
MSRKAQIQAMLADSPTDAFLRFALAKEHEKEGDDAGAKKIYEGIIADQPEYVGTYYHLGKTLERLEEQTEAWKVYSEGISVTKRLGERHAMSELAGARMELGDEEDFL